MIKGGYILQPRKIDESDIMDSPPHIREIWIYILRKANHSDNDKFKRGQLFTSYKQIINDLSWHIGYRKESYKKHHCEIAMKALTKKNMITTTKTTRGLIITICNYDYYQNPKNYECYNETTTKTTRKLQSNDTINKNDKKEKNDKKVNIPSFSDFEIYALSKKSNLNLESLKFKYDAWRENGWVDGNGKQIKNWKSKLLSTIPYLKVDKVEKQIYEPPKNIIQ